MRFHAGVLTVPAIRSLFYCSADAEKRNQVWGFPRAAPGPALSLFRVKLEQNPLVRLTIHIRKNFAPGSPVLNEFRRTMKPADEFGMLEFVKKRYAVAGSVGQAALNATGD